VAETGVEQFVRDVRITQIYEGTNGIQALDLVRRKLNADEGAGVAEFLRLVRRSIDGARSRVALVPHADAMLAALCHLEVATAWMQQHAADGEAIAIAAGATEYLRLFGLVALGWVWLDYASICSAALERGDGHAEFHQRKLALAGFYMRRVLPSTEALARIAQLGAADVMGLAPDAF
jgi:hypothetical protein